MLIKNGLVATPEGSIYADVRTEGEVILCVGKDLIPEKGEEVIDASGRWVLPGGIDAHTHFDMPFGEGETTADDFTAGTRAAVAGGTTTVLDFPEASFGETMADSLALWHQKADGRSYCDYSFHVTVSSWNADCRGDYAQMVREGITSFKTYTCYHDSIGVDDGTLYRILRNIKEVGGLLLVHCENGDLMNTIAAGLAEKEPAKVKNHALSRPNLVEAEAVSRVIDIAALAGAPVYIVHVSTKEALDRIAAARARGQEVYAETCPHYLLFDDSKYDSNDLTAAGYVMSPPLRSPADCARLWNGLKTGEVDAVSTDHCTFTSEQKAPGLKDFRQLPGGVPGVETRLELIYHAGIARGLTIGSIAKMTAEQPAKIFGLYPKKGVIAPGSDADIVIMNPFKEHTYTAADQVTATDYSIYEGMTVRKKVEAVILRGRLIYRDGEFTDEKPGGQFLSCAAVH